MWIFDSYHRGTVELWDREEGHYMIEAVKLSRTKENALKNCGWSSISPSRPPTLNFYDFAVAFFAIPPILVTFGVIQVGAVTLAAVIFVAAMAVPS
jgi:hypothetical protein